MKFELRKKAMIAALLPAFGLALTAPSIAQGAGSEDKQGAQAQSQQGAQQQESRAQQTAQVRDMRASKILGANVKGANGKDLGNVQDLIVDTSSGRANYAILAFGGFLGFGEKLFAYPMNQFNATGEDQLVLNVSEDKLKNAPGFDRSNWPTWGTGGYRGEVDKYFGQTAKSGGNLVRMSEILDTQVSDRTGNEVGQIEDAVVSIRDGQIRFVALKPAGDLEIDDNQLVMLPMDAIRATSEQQFKSQVQAQQGQQAQQAQQSQPGQPQDQTMASGQSQQEQQMQSSGGSQQQSSTGMPPKAGEQQAQQQQSEDGELKLVLNVEPQQLRNARTFEEGQWPDLNNPSFQREVDSYVASFPSGGTASGASGEQSEGQSGGASSMESQPAEQTQSSGSAAKGDAVQGSEAGSTTESK